MESTAYATSPDGVGGEETVTKSPTTIGLVARDPCSRMRPLALHVMVSPSGRVRTVYQLPVAFKTSAVREVAEP